MSRLRSKLILKTISKLKLKILKRSIVPGKLALTRRHRWVSTRTTFSPIMSKTNLTVNSAQSRRQPGAASRNMSNQFMLEINSTVSNAERRRQVRAASKATCDLFIFQFQRETPGSMLPQLSTPQLPQLSKTRSSEMNTLFKKLYLIKTAIPFIIKCE